MPIIKILKNNKDATAKNIDNSSTEQIIKEPVINEPKKKHFSFETFKSSITDPIKNHLTSKPYVNDLPQPNLTSKSQNIMNKLFDQMVAKIKIEIARDNQNIKKNIIVPILHSLFDLLYPYILLIYSMIFLILIINIILLVNILTTKK
jgi:hypothetical protein